MQAYIKLDTPKNVTSLQKTKINIYQHFDCFCSTIVNTIKDIIYCCMYMQRCLMFYSNTVNDLIYVENSLSGNCEKCIFSIKKYLLLLTINVYKKIKDIKIIEIRFRTSFTFIQSKFSWVWNLRLFNVTS